MRSRKIEFKFKFQLAGCHGQLLRGGDAFACAPTLCAMPLRVNNIQTCPHTGSCRATILCVPRLAFLALYACVCCVRKWSSGRLLMHSSISIACNGIASQAQPRPPGRSADIRGRQSDSKMYFHYDSPSSAVQQPRGAAAAAHKSDSDSDGQEDAGGGSDGVGPSRHQRRPPDRPGAGTFVFQRRRERVNWRVLGV
jgi:hypothetical protein